MTSLLALAGVAASVGSSTATAQAFPNRPIRVVVPYPPGGSNDIMGRLVGQKFSEGLGVQVVVDLEEVSRDHRTQQDPTEARRRVGRQHEMTQRHASCRRDGPGMPDLEFGKQHRARR